MLIHGARLANCPVLSLHVGGRIASVVEPIIDPKDLKIIAFRVDGPLVGREAGEILPVDSIREFSRLGMIVDSVDEFVETDEVVRISDVMKLDFNLVGLKVESQKGSKLGKVTDYTVNSDSWQVQQLIVQRPFIKAFFDPELTIGRSKIVEITNSKIVIKEETEKSSTKATAGNDFIPSFVNPFREPDFATDARAHKETQE